MWEGEREKRREGGKREGEVREGGEDGQRRREGTGEDAKNEKRKKASAGPTLREVPLPKVIP